jgi:ubiquinone/menaquinone biosynthesis C-methylase UbiE
MTTPQNPAETYERYMVPVLFGPWARRLVELVDPQRGERVLDVACGTGIVARVAARHAGRGAKVTGLDMSPGMLEVARSSFGLEGHEVEWVEAPAERMPFPGGSFDVALCQFALMFFEDRHAALSEMHRVLDDDGRIGIAVWQELERHPFYETLHDVIRWHLGTSGVGDIFTLGDAEALRAMVAEAGFHTISIRSLSMTARFPDPAGFLAGEIDVDTASVPAMQSLTPGARATLVEQIRDDMAAALAKVTEGDHVVLPFHAHIVSAYR